MAGWPEGLAVRVQALSLACPSYSHRPHAAAHPRTLSCVAWTRRCAPGGAPCCAVPGAAMLPRCVAASDVLTAPHVCALPPIPRRTGAVSAASPDGASLVVTVAAAAHNGGTSAQLAYTCTIKSGATSYSLTVAAPKPVTPTTPITFAPGSTDTREPGGRPCMGLWACCEPYHRARLHACSTVCRRRRCT